MLLFVYWSAEPKGLGPVKLKLGSLCWAFLTVLYEYQNGTNFYKKVVTRVVREPNQPLI